MPPVRKGRVGLPEGLGIPLHNIGRPPLTDLPKNILFNPAAFVV